MRINVVNVKQLMVRDRLKQKDVAALLRMHPTAFSFTLKNGHTTQEIAERLSTIFKVPFSTIADNLESVILPDPGEDPILLSKIKVMVDLALDAKLAPLITEIQVLHKLIDMINHLVSKS